MNSDLLWISGPPSVMGAAWLLAREWLSYKRHQMVVALCKENKDAAHALAALAPWEAAARGSKATPATELAAELKAGAASVIPLARAPDKT